jgi:hypothetical protein
MPKFFWFGEFLSVGLDTKWLWRIYWVGRVWVGAQRKKSIQSNNRPCQVPGPIVFSNRITYPIKKYNGLPPGFRLRFSGGGV